MTEKIKNKYTYILETNDCRFFFQCKKKAEQDDADSQFNLGLMYSTGTNVKQDFIEAVKWYTKATEQGHTEAEYNLGLMYKLGKGVLKNQSKAIFFLEKAANKNHTEAKNVLSDIRKQLKEKKLKSKNTKLLKNLIVSANIPGCLLRTIASQIFLGTGI